MKIGIIYLTTEAYNKFWKDFYCICEQYFCVDAEKEQHYHGISDVC